VAVMQTMPTYTPIPHYPAMEQRVLDGQRRELMEEAQKTVTVMQHLIPILAPQPTPEPPLTPYPLGPPTQTAGAGTIVWTNACTRGKIISAQNEWYTIEGNNVTGVCVGGSYTGQPRGQISIDVYDLHTDATISGPDVYTVPATVQWVKVIDAVGERLTFEADTGALFYFDIPTRQWVNP
jgi:hypothetical protein